MKGAEIMRCVLCGRDIAEEEKFLANPLCAKDNFKANCCESCVENYVRPANRVMGSTSAVTYREPMEGDKLILFYVKDEAGENRILDKLMSGEGEMFLTGKVESINQSLSSVDGDMIYRGSWGNFPVRLSDSFINLGNDY